MRQGLALFFVFTIFNNSLTSQYPTSFTQTTTPYNTNNPPLQHKPQAQTVAP